MQAIAGDGWYVELSGSLANKEAHMMIQGAWVAEMAELDSLSRTEETRLKAFITLKQDSWIPKYSNLRLSVPRRCIFIGTTNEESYLKGQHGNTRFLPIKTGAIEAYAFELERDQIFAEALHVYRAAPLDWWRWDGDTMEAAAAAREARRPVNVYEDAIADWLDKQPNPHKTTWNDVADKCLRLNMDRWANKGLQMQVADALKRLGFKRGSDRQDSPDGTVTRFWYKRQPNDQGQED